MKIDPRKVLVPLAVAVVITAGLGRMFWPFLARPAEMKFFGYLDAWVYTGPVLFYGDRVVSDGELPLWNPLVFCGQPIAGNPQYLIFYPPNTLRSWLTPGPTPWNTNVGIVILLYLHALWAGFGAYMLGRAHRLSRFAAFCAAVLFVFSAPFTQRLFLHHHLIMVASWFPWTCLLLRKTMYEPIRRRAFGWCVLLGGAFGMAILAGSPQMTYLLGFSLGLYWLLTRCGDMAARLREKAAGQGMRAVSRDVALGIVAILIAAGIAAALMLPAAQLIRETPRVAESGDKIEMGPSVEPWDLREVLSIYTGSPNHEGIKAIGASGLLLCLVGLFATPRRDAALFGVMSLLLLDASSTKSYFMLDLIARLAPFPISSPGRLMMMTALPIALLAGSGVDRLRSSIQPAALRILSTVLVIAAGVSMLDAIYWRLLALAENGVRPPYPMALISLASATLLLLIAALWFPSRRWIAVMVVAIALLEPVCWRAIWGYNVGATRWNFYRHGPVVAHSRPDFHLDTARESVRFPNTALYTLTPQINGYDPLQLRGFKEMVAPPGQDVFWRGIVEAQRFSIVPDLLLKRLFWLQSAFVRGPIPPRSEAFAPAVAAFIESPPALHVPEMAANNVVGKMHSGNVVRVPLDVRDHRFQAAVGVAGTMLKLPLPPYDFHRFTVLHLRVRSDCKAELDVRLPERVLRAKSELMALLPLVPDNGTALEFDVPLPDVESSVLEIQPFYMGPGDTVVVEHAELVLDQSDESDHVRILTNSANAIEVEVRDLPSYRILTYIDFAYPGWHAYVDDQEVPILKAFSYFKAVEIPPGTHRVRFVFRPRIVPVGIGISLAAVLLCTVLLAWAFRRARPAAFGVHSSP